MTTQLPHRGEPLVELILETLRHLDPASQNAFIQRFLKNLASAEVSDTESLAHWQEMLQRRTELSRPVSPKADTLDYLYSSCILHDLVALAHHDLKALRQDAATDALTGLYNRRSFDACLSKELHRCRRHNHPLALVLADLRNFKQVNDTYGHTIGDEVLRRLARAITETIRGSDYPCRLGGDELAILLPESDSLSAHVLAQRISLKFKESITQLIPDVELGLDYGIASFPENGESAAGLFEAADRQLYVGKKNSSGCESKPRPTANLPSDGEASSLPSYRHQRRDPRISMQGSGAYAIIRNGSNCKAGEILDLSSGGIGFLINEPIELPNTFLARLQFPNRTEFVKLPLHEFRVRRVYISQLRKSTLRVGASFMWHYL